jgi:glycosyltransferase involved in cell wall biosynthesis
MDDTISSRPSSPQKAILYIAHEYPPIIGGVAFQVEALVDEMRSEAPLVVLTAGPGLRTTREERDGCLILRLGLPFRHPRYHYASAGSSFLFVLKALYHGLRLCRRFRFKVIHAFFVVPGGLVAVILGRLMKIPSCVTAIGGEVYPAENRKKLYNRWRYRKMIGTVLRNATRVSAISTRIADVVKTYCCERRIEILPPGITEYSPMPELQPHKDFVISSLSRLYPIKGIDLIIEALAHLKHLPIRYEIVGDGVSMSHLRALAGKLGVLDRITFHGFVAEPRRKYDILTKCDVFVMTPIHEAFCLTLLETMSAGLPVIATDTGGHTDYFVHNKNGILLQRRSKHDLVRAVEELYRDPERRARMSQANKETAKLYYIRNLKKMYLSHYAQAAE